MPFTIPQFLSVTSSSFIPKGWKNICIIPTGTVTLSNTLNPNQYLPITSAFMIGIGTQNTDFWSDITVTGTATVIINGYAQA